MDALIARMVKTNKPVVSVKKKKKNHQHDKFDFNDSRLNSQIHGINFIEIFVLFILLYFSRCFYVSL